MKRLFFRSLVVSLVLAPLSAFAITMLSVSHMKEYRPPFTETEMSELRKLTIEKAEVIMEARAVKLSRAQWLVESVGGDYFWKQLAQGSIVPFAAIFSGCILVGSMERRREVSVADIAHLNGES